MVELDFRHRISSVEELTHDLLTAIFDVDFAVSQSQNSNLNRRNFSEYDLCQHSRKECSYRRPSFYNRIRDLLASSIIIKSKKLSSFDNPRKHFPLEV